MDSSPEGQTTDVAEAEPPAAARIGRSRRPARPWPPPQGQWTFADYAGLPDNGFRYEVIHGGLYMSPASRPRHQRAVTRLAHALGTHLERHPIGEVYVAPIDVILPDLAEPVQPDVIFVAAERQAIVSDSRVEAAPDLVVEVLSKATARRDRTLKFALYAQAGVREYWIVDAEPATRSIEVYVLRGDAYALAGAFGPGETVGSEVLPGCGVAVDRVCPE